VAPKISDMHIVATAVREDGTSFFVDCAVRPCDIEADVLIYLQEKASGMHGDQTPLPDGFDVNDAPGG
jgi:hypothetical protein